MHRNLVCSKQSDKLNDHIAYTIAYAASFDVTLSEGFGHSLVNSHSYTITNTTCRQQTTETGDRGAFTHALYDEQVASGPPPAAATAVAFSLVATASGSVNKALTENAGLETNGRSKLRDMKLQNMKMYDV